VDKNEHGLLKHAQITARVRELKNSIEYFVRLHCKKTRGEKERLTVEILKRHLSGCAFRLRV